MKDADATDIESMSKALSATLREPEWGLGISTRGELMLCLDLPAAEKSIS